jgi:uncharacterized protein YfbU (UPF0304 family)
MTLSHTERWILSNQFRILEILDKDNAEHWARAKEVIDRGYEGEYESVSQDVDPDVVTEDQCREVLDILLMFQSLHRAYEDLPDKSEIEESRIKFAGFDGNNEGAQWAYTMYFCNLDGGRFTSLERGDNFNSHWPVLDHYRAMLSEWEKSQNKRQLSKEDVLRITGAAS